MTLSSEDSGEMLFPDGRIMVFCKAPVPGQVKTRLAKTIGESAATTIHEYLAWHCLKNIVAAKIAPVELWCAPGVDHNFFQQCEDALGVSLKVQKGGCLGERMEYAFSKYCFKSQPSIVIGTDCPVMSIDYLKSAFLKLEQTDSVIGPAEDGGYVLLGLRKLQPKIFSNMPWGTPQVFAETMLRLQGDVARMTTLWDVDREDDLKRLRTVAHDLPMEEGFLKYLIEQR